MPIMHADSTRSRDPSQDVHGRSGAETLGSVAEFKGQETIEVDEDFFSRNQHFFQFHSLSISRETNEFSKGKKCLTPDLASVHVADRSHNAYLQSRFIFDFILILFKTN